MSVGGGRRNVPRFPNVLVFGVMVGKVLVVAAASCDSDCRTDGG